MSLVLLLCFFFSIVGPYVPLYEGAPFKASVLEAYGGDGDDVNWEFLNSGVSGTDFFPYVSSLALDDNGNLYVGGAFTHAGDKAVNHIAMWDGENWHALGSGENVGVSDTVWSLGIQ